MRLRTKIFLGWVVLTLLLWGGAFWTIRRSVEQTFNSMADEAFVGINRGLRQMYIERVSGMRQACQLVINIPELRALIAEQNYELVAENQDSLRERLDYVNNVVEATFLCALNASGTPVAMNRGSPWKSPAELDRFLTASPAAQTLLARTFRSRESGQYALWVYQGQLYQVAAVPLIFQSDGDPSPSRPEGALIMGRQLTDAVSQKLGQSYGCEITFLAGRQVAASSLAPTLAAELAAVQSVADGHAPTVMRLGGRSYRTALQPLVDPASGQTVGTAVIQEDQSHAQDFVWEVWRHLTRIMAGGIVIAACGSFLLSLAVTRPVQALVHAVRGVGQGRLDVAFDFSGRDELGQLAGAFNDMVGRLRSSRDEQQRLLDEARTSAQRERLLHEVAQQINQRLDVQSTLTMFINSARNLFPDIQLAVFRYEPEQRQLVLLGSGDTGEDTPAVPDAPGKPIRWQTGLPALSEPATLDRLTRHELVQLDHEAPTMVSKASGERWTTCLVPMRAAQRMLGAVAITRPKPDAFTLDQQQFLLALADHFAIALANAQVYEELRKAYHDLRVNQRQIIQTERLRALGQMASGIAHDFNNHLTGVLAFLEMALDREVLDDELRGWLQMSRESSLAAAEVVTLLRNFYRRDTDETLEPVDINKLAAITISLTRPRWFDMPRRHGLTVHVHEDLHDVGFVLGNTSELRDVLTNLLFNAVDAMPEGGDITIRTRRAGDKAVVEIIDNGTGMPDEVREQCLDPFYTTKGTQGTGLGLSMVHGIIERHHGRLEIDSQLGRGTTIRFILPSAQAAPSEQEAPQDADENSPRRILCVDDDQRVLLSLAGMLRQMGHEVATIGSGAEAIEHLQSASYDVLITDLGMPGVDGHEVARNAKRIAPHMRVLLLTGWADRLRVEGDIPEGVDQLLGKPITKAQLQEAVAPAPIAAPAASG